MQEREESRSARGTAGAANTPPFGAEPRAVETAADHQIAAPGDVGRSERNAEAERPIEQSPDVPAYSAIAAAAEDEAADATRVKREIRPEDDAAGARDSNQAETRAGDGNGRARDPISDAMMSAAERIEDAAERIEALLRHAGEGSGARARAGEMGAAVTDVMGSMASYLRDHDARDLRSDIENQVRTRPVQTLLVGLAAGWVTGKIIR